MGKIRAITNPEELQYYKDYFLKVAKELNALHGNPYDLRYFNLKEYVSKLGGRITLYIKGGKPAGIMMARLAVNIWDESRKMYKQDTLYCKYPRGVYMLLEDFIDYGKTHADDVFTMIGPQTRLKGDSLRRLGFKEFEILYRLED